MDQRIVFHHRNRKSTRCSIYIPKLTITQNSICQSTRATTCSVNSYSQPSLLEQIISVSHKRNNETTVRLPETLFIIAKHTNLRNVGMARTVSAFTWRIIAESGENGMEGKEE